VVAPTPHERLTSALRVVMALAALLIYAADPSEHPSRRPLAQGVLGLFLAYGVAAYLLVTRRGRGLPAALAPWIDVGWVTLLVAVSEGSSSIFYPLYLFPILEASFGLGFRAGMAVVLFSAFSFATVGVITAPPPVARLPFLVRSLYLLVLGYLTAVWGAYEVRSRARLALLREVTRFSNPRFGIDRTAAHVLESVRAFYDADQCALVVPDDPSSQLGIRTAVRGAPPAYTSVPASLGALLLAAPPNAALRARHRRRWSGRRQVEVDLVDLGEGRRESGDERTGTTLLTALDAGAVLSVPFRYHAGATGRIFVARRDARAFDPAEMDFLRHVVDQVLPTLENIRLVDRLASDAAEEERRRIARDLHDSVIQPYLGLRLGLSAAQTAFAAGRGEDARAHVDRLAELADGELERLRSYVRVLRAGDPGTTDSALDSAVRRFAGRFSGATGIRVDVVTSGPPARNDRLAAEVFQMVAEGLSNVRRHSTALRAEVRLEVSDGKLELTIQNDGAESSAAFRPRSLAERAAALGGTLRVEHREPGTTAVRIEIPL
jgi:signal transduction histidine kinase